MFRLFWQINNSLPEHDDSPELAMDNSLPVNNIVPLDRHKLLEFQEKGFLCDSILMSKSKTFQAHSLLLATVSPFFLEVFETDSESRLEVYTTSDYRGFHCGILPPDCLHWKAPPPCGIPKPGEVGCRLLVHAGIGHHHQPEYAGIWKVQSLSSVHCLPELMISQMLQRLPIISREDFFHATIKSLLWEVARVTQPYNNNNNQIKYRFIA